MKFLILFLAVLATPIYGQVLRDHRERNIEIPKKDKSLIHKNDKKLLPAPAEINTALTAWDEILKKHLIPNKGVSYTTLDLEFAKLESFVNSHKSLKLNKLTEESRLATYINLYNAGMMYNLLKYVHAKKIAVNSPEFLKLEINNLDIPGDIWSSDDYRLPLGSEMVTLNNIEHGLIRNSKSGRGKFPAALEGDVIKTLDPRIHAAVNCAALSCPPVREKAYRAENLQTMLQENIESYVNSTSQFAKLSETKLKANKIVFWYYSDFDQTARKNPSFKGAGDYLASFIKDTTSDAIWKRNHFHANFNDRSTFALRFSNSFDFFYDWRVNDTRNF